MKIFDTQYLIIGIRLTYEKKIFNAIQLKTAQQARKSQFLTSLTILKKGSEI